MRSARWNSFLRSEASQCRRNCRRTGSKEQHQIRDGVFCVHSYFNARYGQGWMRPKSHKDHRMIYRVSLFYNTLEECRIRWRSTKCSRNAVTYRIQLVVEEAIIRHYRRLLKTDFENSGAIENPSIFCEGGRREDDSLRQHRQLHASLYRREEDRIENIRYVCSCEPTANVAVEALCALVRGKSLMKPPRCRKRLSTAS